MTDMGDRPVRVMTSGHDSAKPPDHVDNKKHRERLANIRYLEEKAQTDFRFLMDMFSGEGRNLEEDRNAFLSQFSDLLRKHSRSTRGATQQRIMKHVTDIFTANSNAKSDREKASEVASEMCAYEMEVFGSGREYVNLLRGAVKNLERMAAESTASISHNGLSIHQREAVADLFAPRAIVNGWARQVVKEFNELENLAIRSHFDLYEDAVAMKKNAGPVDGDWSFLTNLINWNFKLCRFLAVMSMAREYIPSINADMVSAMEGVMPKMPSWENPDVIRNTISYVEGFASEIEVDSYVNANPVDALMIVLRSIGTLSRKSVHALLESRDDDVIRIFVELAQNAMNESTKKKNAYHERYAMGSGDYLDSEEEEELMGAPSKRARRGKMTGRSEDDGARELCGYEGEYGKDYDPEMEKQIFDDTFAEFVTERWENLSSSGWDINIDMIKDVLRSVSKLHQERAEEAQNMFSPIVFNAVDAIRKHGEHRARYKSREDDGAPKRPTAGVSERMSEYIRRERETTSLPEEHRESISKASKLFYDMIRGKGHYLYYTFASVHMELTKALHTKGYRSPRSSPSAQMSIMWNEFSACVQTKALCGALRIVHSSVAPQHQVDSLERLLDSIEKLPDQALTRRMENSLKSMDSGTLRENGAEHGGQQGEIRQIMHTATESALSSLSSKRSEDQKKMFFDAGHMIASTIERNESIRRDKLPEGSGFYERYVKDFLENQKEIEERYESHLKNADDATEELRKTIGSVDGKVLEDMEPMINNLSAGARIGAPNPSHVKGGKHGSSSDPENKPFFGLTVLHPSDYVSDETDLQRLKIVGSSIDLLRRSLTEPSAVSQLPPDSKDHERKNAEHFDRKRNAMRSAFHSIYNRHRNIFFSSDDSIDEDAHVLLDGIGSRHGARAGAAGVPERVSKWVKGNKTLLMSLSVCTMVSILLYNGENVYETLHSTLGSSFSAMGHLLGGIAGGGDTENPLGGMVRKNIIDRIAGKTPEGESFMDTLAPDGVSVPRHVKENIMLSLHRVSASCGIHSVLASAIEKGFFSKERVMENIPEVRPALAQWFLKKDGGGSTSHVTSSGFGGASRFIKTSMHGAVAKTAGAAACVQNGIMSAGSSLFSDLNVWVSSVWDGGMSVLNNTSRMLSTHYMPVLALSSGICSIMACFLASPVLTAVRSVYRSRNYLLAMTSTHPEAAHAAIHAADESRRAKKSAVTGKPVLRPGIMQRREPMEEAGSFETSDEEQDDRSSYDEEEEEEEKEERRARRSDGRVRDYEKAKKYQGPAVYVRERIRKDRMRRERGDYDGSARKDPNTPVRRGKRERKPPSRFTPSSAGQESRRK